ncbi:hypothetical protein EYF80_000348 [Liparis tanakae]|uniref:Uncharacterized protein n=1 Tax=Liparis tanakae TaxID=230148 RepID=A0A4Z2JFW3_9TELE|nr:hypothetical protein EYF80_000348 [Liparis tanakae]
MGRCQCVETSCLVPPGGDSREQGDHICLLFIEEKNNKKGVRVGRPIGGPLNEEADLQQALSLLISHVVLIYNNTAGEEMRPKSMMHFRWGDGRLPRLGPPLDDSPRHPLCASDLPYANLPPSHISSWAPQET